MGTKYKRKRLWVDSFQSRLLLRMGLYLFVFCAIVWHIGFIFHVVGSLAAHGIRQGAAGLYLEYRAAQKPLLYAIVLTGPIFIHDLLKFSNRVAGPLFRCRKVMAEMAEGKPVAEFTPRKYDFMGELFRAFNALIRAWNARVPPGANGHADEANGTATRTEEKGPYPATTSPADSRQVHA
jgi:hypothetical protein